MFETSERTVLTLIVGMTIAAMSLLAIWAAMSPRPWHHRAIVLLGTLALFLPPGMYEPILFFATQWVMTIGLLLCVRRLRIAKPPSDAPNPRRPIRPRFHLSDLCWLVTLSSAAIAILAVATRRSEPFPWHDLLGQAVITAAIAVMASVAVLLRWRVPWRIVAIALFVTVVGFGALWCRQLGWIDSPYTSILWLDTTLKDAYAGMCVIDACLVLLLLVAWKGARKPIVAEPSRGRTIWRNLPTYICKGVMTAALLFSAVLFPWLYWQMTVLPPIPEIVNDPRPNRLTELVTLVSQLENVTIPDIDTGDSKEFATFATKHETLLRDAHILLRGRCHEELDWPSNPEAFRERLSRTGGKFKLARAYVVSGAHAANGQRFDAAWKNHAAIFDLAQTEIRGGLLIDLLVGFGIERIGMNGCRRMRDALPPSQRTSLLDRLRDRRRDFESLDIICDRDLAWSARAYGWTGRLYIAITRLAMTEINHELDMESSVATANARFQLLVTDLAIRIFRDRHDRLPDSLAELTPKLLPIIPIDPFTDDPLVYRRDGNDYVLYSVGQNKVDDGGTVVTDSGKETVIAGQRRDAFLPGEWFDQERGDLFLDENDWVRLTPVE